MIKTGVLIGILLLLIGSTYAGDNISNSTNGTNQSTDESQSYTEDDMMNAINHTDKDSGEYVDDINMAEDGKYPNNTIGTKPSPGFETIMVVAIIILTTIIRTNKR